MRTLLKRPVTQLAIVVFGITYGVTQNTGEALAGAILIVLAKFWFFTY